MSTIGSIGSTYANPALLGLGPQGASEGATGPSALVSPASTTATPSTGDGFGKMIDGLVSSVDAKEAAADAISNKVMLGQSNQLHQSVIAMQEASVAFSLMVQVRNKLVDSYQELMRMQV